MGKQETLDQLNELLNIPQIERIIHHKIEELKLNLSDEIEHYRRVKQKFLKSAYGEMTLCDREADENLNVPVYHFELNANDSNEWKVTALEPAPPPGFSFYDIMPEEVVSYVSHFEIAPGKVETIQGLCLPELEGLSFNLMFTKYSKQFILGTIQTIREASDQQNNRNETKKTEEFYDYGYLSFDNEMNLKEMVYFLQKYPDLKAYFLTQFQMKMKPLIQNELVHFTSVSRPMDLF